MPFNEDGGEDEDDDDDGVFCLLSFVLLSSCLGCSPEVYRIVQSSVSSEVPNGH